MPAWAWVVVFVGIAVAGFALHLAILLELKYKTERIMAVVAPLQQKISELVLMKLTESDYLAPVNNLGDDPVVATQIWLKRQYASEQRKAARQRRLISRLTKRK
jgi:hypothetical protein